MQFTAQQIATLLGGSLHGNPDATVHTVAKIEEAGPGALSFIANPKYEGYLTTTGASVVIVNDSLDIPADVQASLIRVPDAYVAFTAILERYHAVMAGEGKTGIEQPSFIAASAQVDSAAWVGAFAYVSERVTVAKGAKIFPGVYIGDGASIGEDSTLHPGVKVYAGCKLGARVVVHSGTVIGADGFGFAPQANGTFKKIPQIGNVVIEDDVEIGANTTIDRATMGNTIIRRGVKLDNLIQVAHNVEVGENTVIAAQTGVSGSTKLGKNCMIGGQVGMVGHIQIADGTRIQAQAGLSKSIAVDGTAVAGSPAFDYKAALKSQAVFRNLPDLQARITVLEETVQRLSDALADS